MQKKIPIVTNYRPQQYIKLGHAAHSNVGHHIQYQEDAAGVEDWGRVV
ncbi:hypothetical protein [Synechococcus sp. PCC 7335]|nr:hypothetical protein [Synechococcus sp. PCC 7335]